MNHMTLADFWQQQPFASIETYSFNRGPRSAAEFERLSQEIAAARQALQTARYMDLAGLRYKLRTLEAAMYGGEYNVRLTNSSTLSEYAVQKVATLTATAGMTRHLGNVAARATVQEAYAMCLPIYRDALVFYNEQHERLQVLNICFECQRMATGANQLIEADFAAYSALMEALVQLGHPINGAAN